MSTAPPEQSVPYPCPRCLKAGGQPYRFAADESQSLRVLLRCDWCHHRWSEIIASDSAIVTDHPHLPVMK
jgi:hypothetical protein